MTTAKELSIVYSSGINVWDISYLNTLAVFYDKILLPYTADNSIEKAVSLLRRSKSEPYIIDNIEVDQVTIIIGGAITTIGAYARDWTEKYDTLFKEGVVERLPKPTETVEELQSLLNTSATSINPTLLDLPDVFRAQYTDGRDYIFIYQDLFTHLLRKDVVFPVAFTVQSDAPVRESLKFLIANSAFKFLLPKISDLGVEEILKIRQHVADTREGFSMHLQKLSGEVETRVQDGDTFEEISRYAQSVVETQLEPDYREFTRQLQAKPTGIIGNILAATGQILEIDASILTPKFYGQLLKAIGFMFRIDSKTRLERLTNHNQAYQFMRSVETTLK